MHIAREHRMYSEDNTNWETCIRSDKWREMSQHQLTIQMELVLDKLGKLSYLSQGDPTVQTMQNALTIALNDLNHLINNKATSQKQQAPL